MGGGESHHAIDHGGKPYRLANAVAVQLAGKIIGAKVISSKVPVASVWRCWNLTVAP